MLVFLCGLHQQNVEDIQNTPLQVTAVGEVTAKLPLQIVQLNQATTLAVGNQCTLH